MCHVPIRSLLDSCKQRKCYRCSRTALTCRFQSNKAHADNASYTFHYNASLFENVIKTLRTFAFIRPVQIPQSHQLFQAPPTIDCRPSSSSSSLRLPCHGPLRGPLSSGYTLCPRKNTCCPGINAVCCPSGRKCCPRGFRCSANEQFCFRRNLAGDDIRMPMDTSSALFEDVLMNDAAAN
ncbi:hypothetical protein L596_020817 [Steinernema carpocapsae]|uniref:Granulins domain-containing protein n=1 Tax=Steinernema carpocapsae TaxID=34508 RepID=A0A4U5MUM7_STECR|nr:hypothetical protein L596_020817 [Steinernema carpocapsae]